MDATSEKVGNNSKEREEGVEEKDPNHCCGKNEGENKCLHDIFSFFLIFYES